jgi:hypothetical protein
VQFGPLFDPPTESVSSELLHCSLFRVSILNNLAVAVDEVDPLELAVSASQVATSAFGA